MSKERIEEQRGVSRVAAVLCALLLFIASMGFLSGGCAPKPVDALFSLRIDGDTAQFVRASSNFPTKFHHYELTIDPTPFRDHLCACVDLTVTGPSHATVRIPTGDSAAVDSPHIH